LHLTLLNLMRFTQAHFSSSLCWSFPSRMD